MENEIPMDEQGGNAQGAAPLGDIVGPMIEQELGPDHHQGQEAVPGNDEQDVDDAADLLFIDNATHRRLWNQLMNFLQTDSEALPFYWHELIRQQVWT
jgi:hypothetical protein